MDAIEQESPFSGQQRTSGRQWGADELPGALSHNEWDALSTMWAEVARFSLAQAEEAARYGLVWLAGLFDASVAAGSLLARLTPFTPRRARRLSGWQAVHPLVMGPDGRGRDHEAAGFLKPTLYTPDPAVQRALSGLGRRRAFCLREVAEDEHFSSSVTKAMMEELGSADRLYAFLPLRSTLEAGVFLDRPHGSPPFTARDQRLLLEALRGFEGMLISLARSAGYIDCLEPLTPKERVVLSQLLTGRREAEIAQDLRMGRRSLHQRVVDVYRKFGVSSRPQLMALWLSSSV